MHAEENFTLCKIPCKYEEKQLPKVSGLIFSALWLAFSSFRNSVLCTFQTDLFILQKLQVSWKKKNLCLTNKFSYFINKHWGITSDTATIKCSKTVLQLYNENNHFWYCIQIVGEKTSKLIALNTIIHSWKGQTEDKSETACQL